MNHAERRLWEGVLQKQEDRLTCCERAFLRLLRSLEPAPDNSEETYTRFGQEQAARLEQEPLVITAVPYATTKNGSAVYRNGRGPVEHTQGIYEPTEETDEP